MSHFYRQINKRMSVFKYFVSMVSQGSQRRQGRSIRSRNIKPIKHRQIP